MVMLLRLACLRTELAEVLLVHDADLLSGKDLVVLSDLDAVDNVFACLTPFSLCSDRRDLAGRAECTMPMPYVMYG